jgi:hypothetical protein
MNNSIVDFERSNIVPYPSALTVKFKMLGSF